MANTFKNNTKSSLVVAAITDPTATVVTAGSTATLIVLSALVSNKTGASANVDVYLDRNTGDDVYLIRNAPVPAGSTLELISGNKVIMQSSDKLQARGDTATALETADRLLAPGTAPSMVTCGLISGMLGRV
jgi:hypothetical protein